MASRKKKGRISEAATQTTSAVPADQASGGAAAKAAKTTPKKSTGSRAARTKRRAPVRAKRSRTKPRVAKAVAERATKSSRSRAAKTKRRGPRRPKGSKAKQRAAKRPSRARRYTPAERAGILAAAKREGLSGPAAVKKFGISQLTYYTWRKKAGGAGPRRQAGTGKGAGMAEEIRRQISAGVTQLLPEIVREEIDAALGGARRRGR